MFYTYVETHKNNIIDCYYNDKGIKKKRIVKYKPCIYIESNNPNTNLKTIDNKSLEKIDFKSIYDYKNFIKEHKNISLYGNVDPKYQYIYDVYRNQKYDLEKIRICYVDIETPGFRFSGPEETYFPITSIAILDTFNNIRYLLSTKPYDKYKNNINIPAHNIRYRKCIDEKDIFYSFIKLINLLFPDIISGFYSLGFDIPYIINRGYKVIGQDINNLSPFGVVSTVQREKKVKQKSGIYKIEKQWKSKILGISVLDYKEQFSKYIFRPMESMSLEYVSQDVLGFGKVDYSEYDSLYELFEKNPQKALDYNIVDVDNLYEIDKIENINNIHNKTALDNNSNFEDCMGTVLLWDNILYSLYLDNNISIQPKNKQKDDRRIPGGFISNPAPKISGWTVVYDINSEYPHIQMSLNLDPKYAYISYKDWLMSLSDDDIQKEIQFKENENKPWSKKHIEFYKKFINERKFDDVDRFPYVDDRFINFDIPAPKDYILSPNGYLFKKDGYGLIPQFVENKYNERKAINKKIDDIDLKLSQLTQDDIQRNIFEKKKKELENDSMKIKISELNSEYGAFCNKSFRLFDYRIASSFTLTGQLLIRKTAEYVENSDIGKKYNIKWEYSDTDAWNFNIEKVVEQFLIKKPNLSMNEIKELIIKFSDKHIYPIIKKAFDDIMYYLNAYKNVMNAGIDKIAMKFFYSASRRYAYLDIGSRTKKYNKPIMKVAGIEIKRSEFPKIVKDRLKIILETILYENFDDVYKIISDFEKEFKKLSPIDIALNTGVRGIETFNVDNNDFKKGTPAHVKAAITYNNYIRDNNLEGNYTKIHDNDKIKYVFLKKPNSIMAESIGFIKRFPNELIKYIDYDRMFERMVLNTVNRIGDKLSVKFEKSKINVNDLF
jgi:DNA polymerase elongation subunit (family B)